MKTCTDFELDLSSLIDGELAGEAALAAIDHLLECAPCAEFFRGARRLEGVAAQLRTAPDELAAPAAEYLWPTLGTRAEKEPGAASGARVPPRGVPAWLRAAALVVIGLGGGFALATVAGPSSSLGDSLAAARPAGLTAARALPLDDHRFVALADQLLGSDPRYQRAMLQLLRLVPALETGEGTERENQPPHLVTASLREERPRRGAR